MDPALLSAFDALRRRDAAGALRALDGLRSSEPLVAGRAASYRAQALRDLDRLDEAERAVAEALRLVKQAGDAEGLAEVRALHASIVAGMAAQRVATMGRDKDAALCDTPTHVLLADAADATERAARMVRKATALADAGRHVEATHLACVARVEAKAAGSSREEVLACLTLARTEPGQVAAHILAAHAIADVSDDMNLVMAVAHAARATAVTLPKPSFG